MVPSTILAGVPQGLRDELLRTFVDIQRNFRDGRWEPSELNGGKFCEVAYAIVKGNADGAYPTVIQKPPNLVDACRILERLSSSLPRSLRIQIPRMLIALYEIRNNRGVGHTGGDVNPNHMDATAVLYMTKWILAEFVRVYHAINTSAATALVDSIVDREVPIVWTVNGKRRILDTSLSIKERTLLLLYHENSAVPVKELVNWLDHSNASVFRRDVLRPAHKDRLLEFDESGGTVQLSPKGARFVEESESLNRHLRAKT